MTTATNILFATTKRFGWSDLIVLFAFLAVGFVVMAWPSIWRTLHFPFSSHWPMYPATVEGVVIHKHADLNGGATYRPEITYSYEVKGEYFGGNYGCDLCTSEDEADLVSELFPKGTKLQVHVHPEKPHVSVLDVDGDHP